MTLELRLCIHDADRMMNSIRKGEISWKETSHKPITGRHKFSQFFSSHFKRNDNQPVCPSADVVVVDTVDGRTHRYHRSMHVGSVCAFLVPCHSLIFLHSPFVLQCSVSLVEMKSRKKNALRPVITIINIFSLLLSFVCRQTGSLHSSLTFCFWCSHCTFFFFWFLHRSLEMHVMQAMNVIHIDFDGKQIFNFIRKSFFSFFFRFYILHFHPIIFAYVFVHEIFIFSSLAVHVQ